MGSVVSLKSFGFTKHDLPELGWEIQLFAIGASWRRFMQCPCDERSRLGRKHSAQKAFVHAIADFH